MTTSTRLLDPAKVAYFRTRIRRWSAKHARRFPWRTTKDPYLVLLAEFLLQQTDVEKAERGYGLLSARYPAVHDLARARPRSLVRVFDTMGLRYRAERLSRCSRAIIREWAGAIPEDPAQLMRLPGVGRYMAHAVCAAAFGARLAAVDCNVVRILDRFFAFRSPGARARDDWRVWEAARQLMSARESRPGQWNWGLLDFAALVCTHRHPSCSTCPVSAECRAQAEGP